MAGPQGGVTRAGEGHAPVPRALRVKRSSMAIWAQVSAPVLHVEARDSETLRRIAHKQTLEEFRQRFRAFRDFREAVIDDAGHMLHHDQPCALAGHLAAFLSQAAAP